MTDFSDILLITDLDGTFFGAGGKLVPRNLEALARFRAHAVNPDVMLRCHAKRLGWEILEWK